MVTFYKIFISIFFFITACVKVEPQKMVPEKFREGQKYFHRVCANCHGPDAIGSKKAPKLIQEKYFQINFPNRKIKQTILNGSSSGAMPSQKNKVSDIEIKEIIKYIRYSQKQPS